MVMVNVGFLSGYGAGRRTSKAPKDCQQSRRNVELFLRLRGAATVFCVVVVSGYFRVRLGMLVDRIDLGTATRPQMVQEPPRRDVGLLLRLRGTAALSMFGQC